MIELLHGYDSSSSDAESEGKKSSDSFTKDYVIPTKVYEIEKQLLMKEIKLKKEAEDALKRQKLAKARGSLKVSEKDRNAIERLKKSKCLLIK